jgi:hypothetical protein
MAAERHASVRVASGHVSDVICIHALALLHQQADNTLPWGCAMMTQLPSQVPQALLMLALTRHSGLAGHLTCVTHAFPLPAGAAARYEQAFAVHDAWSSGVEGVGEERGRGSEAGAGIDGTGGAGRDPQTGNRLWMPGVG